jgi:ABC-2 type transport system permease protein
MAKFWHFMKRDLVTTLSYRLAFVLGIASTAIGAVRFAFMAGFLQEGNQFPAIQQYGGDLMAYLISGTLFMALVSVSLTSFQGAIRSEQQSGTLEFLLLSDTPLIQILLYSASWNYILNLTSVGIVFAVLVLGFRIPLKAQVTPLLTTLVLSTTCTAGIGMVSAGIIMVTKKGDPVAWIVGTLSGFLSGVLFPVESLPVWLQKASVALPTTYALSALRKTLIAGSGFGEVSHELTVLALMSCVTVPCGIISFLLGFRKARKDGTLTEY